MNKKLLEIVIYSFIYALKLLADDKAGQSIDNIICYYNESHLMLL